MFRSSSLAALLSCSALLSTPAAALPPDTSLAARKEAALLAVAADYVFEDQQSNCVQLGFSTIRLAAKMEVHARGLPGGLSVTDALDDIEAITGDVMALVGTGGTSGPCAWENAGSPAALHAALGLGLIAHRFGDALPDATRASLRSALKSKWRADIAPHLVNGNLSIIAGRLLGGEGLDDDELWAAGMERLSAIHQRVAWRGSIELNSPTYTHYQLAALAPLTDLADDLARQKARTLLEYILVVQGHLYLPGGGLGAPQSRDYQGGASDPSSNGLELALRLLTGDDFPASANVHLGPLSISGYEMPPVLRSVFLDKGEGYELWAYTDAPVGGSRFPNAVYPFGEGGDDVAPWQAVVTPDAMLGVSHGFRFQAIHVSMGVYAKAPDGRFPILYHHQPFVVGDTTDTGSGLPSQGTDTDPDDFRKELYDYERLLYGRTLVSLWDPTLAGKAADVVRTHQDTRAHVPSYAAFGGEEQTAGRWRVGRLGDTYIAYHPLGTIAAEESRDDGEWTYYRLAGRSGAVIELATTDDFATLDDYVADLASRQVTFTTEPLAAVVDAFDPVTKAHVPIRLEHRPERRFVDDVEWSAEEALDHGFLASAFVSSDEVTKVVELVRGCYEGLRWDWQAGTVTTLAPPSSCDAVEETVFSPVPYFGDAESWEPRSAERWHVVSEDGDLRLAVAPFVYDEAGQRLGEHALVKDRTYEDFHLAFDVKSNVHVEAVSNADYAVVFGFEDELNHIFFLANSTPAYNELFVVEDGVRRSLGSADVALLEDQGWHRVELVKEGDGVDVWLDGALVFSLTADELGASSGRVGLGTLNDSAFFDDVEVTVPGAPSDGGSEGGAPCDVVVDAGPVGADADDGVVAEGGAAAPAGPDGGDALFGGDEGQSEAPAGCSCEAASPGSEEGALFAAALFSFLLGRRRARPSRR